MVETSLSRRRLKRWVRTAAGGYLIVGAFGLGYLLTRSLVEGSDATTAVVVGALVSAPLALAFVWHRLTALKAFGVEVSLSAAAVPLDTSLETDLSSEQYFSGKEHLLEKISEAIRKPDLHLIEINLRSEPYWWSTRLYLQAALLDEFSQVRRLVFVEGDSARRYVGMASPRDVRQCFAAANPALETSYLEIRSRLAAQEGEVDLIRALIEGWAAGMIGGLSEMDARDYVTARTLGATLGPRLQTDRILHEGPETALLHFRVLDLAADFVPIVTGNRLERVIDAGDLARRRSLADLQRLLTR